ncbi:uncharacterized protein METZ01_LOCUS469663 [marine metagenome]|uniref:Glycosyltransferase RgtA/B/C/D-like domain-containing protein n=1 Tax=marine metagenome TaxID=408172 RepID=A0A383BAK9_9ZZZZ
MSHDHYLYRNYSRNKLSVLFISLVLIALCMRLWELDARVMHYDEAIHLHYSWKLANLEIFKHSPWMHGPLQIEFVALAMSLFGVALGDSGFFASAFGSTFGVASTFGSAFGVAFSLPPPHPTPSTRASKTA